MNPTTDLGRYTATLLLDLERHLLSYQEKKGRGPLHKFRVTSKHTRSLLRFQATLKGGHVADKMLVDLRTIFQQAGAVRESQLLLQWMHLHRKPGLIRHFGTVDINQRQVDKLLKSIPGFLDKLHKRADRLIALSDKTTERQLANYRQGILAIFLDKLESGILPGRWHGARKRIKTLQHMDNWPGMPGVGDKAFAAWARHLDAFQAVVGAWHDTGDMLAWFGHEAQHLRGNTVLEKECATSMILLEERYAEQFIAVKKELGRLERYARNRRSGTRNRS